MWYHYHVKGCYGIAILKFFRFQKSIVSLTIVPAIATYATLREFFKDIPVMNLKRAQTEKKKRSLLTGSLPSSPSNNDL
jgi:hypothetical protein